MTIRESLQAFWAGAVAKFPALVGAVIVLAVAILLARLASRALAQALRGRSERQAVVLFLQRLVRWSIIVVGVLTALSMLGAKITGAIAGLGVSGVVLGLALQDVAANFVAGIILLFRRAYKIGDAVSIANVDGTVIDMTTRDTTIRRWDGELAILPNSTIFGSIITNYSEAPLRQRTIRYELSRTQNVPHVIELIRGAAASVEGIAQDRIPTVYAEGLGSYGIILALRFWVDTRTRGLLEVHSDVAVAVNAALIRENIDVPLPTHTLLMQPPGGSPDPVEPARQ